MAWRSRISSSNRAGTRRFGVDWLRYSLNIWETLWSFWRTAGGQCKKICSSRGDEQKEMVAHVIETQMHG